MESKTQNSKSPIATADPRRALTQLCAIVGFLGAAGVTVAHVAALNAGGHDIMATPVSALSRGDAGIVHTLGLCAFALAHISLFVALRDRDHGTLWALGRVLVLAAGVGILGVAAYFALAHASRLMGPEANDPLSAVASVVGIAMAALQRGWARQSRRMGRVNAAILGVWLVLVPLILLVNETWLGAYERLVGITYVVWIASQSLAVLASSGAVAVGDHTP